MNFWKINRGQGNNTITIEPDCTYPFYVKKHIATKFYEMKHILDFYTKKYEKYNFKYSYHFDKIPHDKLSNDYESYENTGEKYEKIINNKNILNDIEEAYKYVKNNENILQKIKTNNYNITYPVFKVTADFLFLNEKDTLSLTKLKKYKSDETKLIVDSIKELFSIFEQLNELKYAVTKIPDDKIFFIDKQKRNVNDLICFLPGYLQLKSDKKKAFEVSVREVSKYLKKITPPKERDYKLTDNVNEITGRLVNIKNRVSGFNFYSKFLIAKNDNKKIKIYTFVDWPNVNKAIYSLDIDWISLFEYIRVDVIEYLLSEKFTSAEFIKIYFVKYEAENYEKKINEEIVKDDTKRIIKICDNLNSENLTAEHIVVKDKTVKENQAVDKEIIERMKLLLNQDNKPDVLILISSDGDYLDILTKLEKNNVKVYIISFGKLAKEYLNKDFKVYELEKLFRFIKEQK